MHLCPDGVFAALGRSIPAPRVVVRRGRNLSLLAAALMAAACADAPTQPDVAQDVPDAPEITNLSELLTASSSDYSWWAGLTATSRGQKIEYAARSLVGVTSSQLSNTYRCDCKLFARYVVNRASRGVWYLGPTVKPPGWYYESEPHQVRFTDYTKTSVRNLQIGDIIQARAYDGGTHTMIVSGHSTDYLYVVDAHWGSCGVRRHGIAYYRFAYPGHAGPLYPKWSAYRGN
jgi:hypothetical protein